MSTINKVLGQIVPSASTLTTLYTVPVDTQAVCSTLSMCNQGTSTTVRVAVRPAGASILSKHYIVYEATVNQYETVFLTLGITLSATDVVSIYSGSANVSFGLFGVEIK